MAISGERIAARLSRLCSGCPSGIAEDGRVTGRMREKQASNANRHELCTLVLCLESQAPNSLVAEHIEDQHLQAAAVGVAVAEDWKMFRNGFL